ncbi:MAG: hypothetical protein HS116_02310 [Planctomycetes bacterium]|nr:hypothetical protein [Planctomycetota bacterium]
MRLYKPQRELVELCARPARGLEIDVVWKSKANLGITTALRAAQGSFEWAQASTAWDALCALSAFTDTTGSGYFLRLLHAVQAIQAKHGKRSVTLAFDNAEPIVPAGLAKIAAAAEDVQRKTDAGLRLVFIVGVVAVYAGRGQGYKSEYPRLSGRLDREYGIRPRVRGFEWRREGLIESKPRDLFTFFDEPKVEAEPVAVSA